MGWLDDIHVVPSKRAVKYESGSLNRNFISFDSSLSLEERIVFLAELFALKESLVDHDVLPSFQVPSYSPEEYVEVRVITDIRHPAYGQAGLFAKKFISSKTILTPYAGVIEEFCTSINSRSYTMGYGSTKNEEYALDAEFVGNYGRFANDPRGVEGQSANVTAETRFTLRGEAFTAMVAKHTIQPGDEILMSYGKEHRLASSLWVDPNGTVLTTPRVMDPAPYPLVESTDSNGGAVANQLLWECCQCGLWNLTCCRVLHVEHCAQCGQPRLVNVKLISVLSSPPITQEKLLGGAPPVVLDRDRDQDMKRLSGWSNPLKKTGLTVKEMEIETDSEEEEEKGGNNSGDHTTVHKLDHAEGNKREASVMSFFHAQLERIAELDDHAEYASPMEDPPSPPKKEEGEGEEEEEEKKKHTAVTKSPKKKRGRPRKSEANQKNDRKKIKEAKPKKEKPSKKVKPLEPPKAAVVSRESLLFDEEEVKKHSRYEAALLDSDGEEGVKSPLSHSVHRSGQTSVKSTVVDWPMNVPFLPWQVWDPCIPLTASYTHSKYTSSSSVLVYMSATTCKREPVGSDITTTAPPPPSLSRKLEGAPRFIELPSGSPVATTRRALLSYERRLFAGETFHKGDVVGYMGGILRRRGDPRLASAGSTLVLPMTALLPAALRDTSRIHGEDGEALKGLVTRYSGLEFVVTNEWMYAPCLSRATAAAVGESEECDQLLKETNTVLVLSMDALGCPFIAAIATGLIAAFEPILCRTQF